MTPDYQWDESRSGVIIGGIVLTGAQWWLFCSHITWKLRKATTNVVDMRFISHALNVI